MKSYIDSRPVDASKYIDFFGFSTEGSIANVKINNMLDTIEELYGNGTMPKITQIMIWSETCGACEKSMPYWRKITDALTKRLPRYSHAAIELNEIIDLGEKRISGGALVKKYNVKGTPAFLQDFKIEIILKKRGSTREVRQVVKTDFYTILEGQLQPFLFLAKSFDIQNVFVESKILNAVL